MAEHTEEIVIKALKNDFLIKTGKNVKISVCNKWESAANFTYKATLDEIILMVMDKTDWKYGEIYTKTRREEDVYRRGLIDYIAINNGESLTHCARKTRRLDHTLIINSIKRFEERLETDMYVRKLFAEVMGFCYENYHLYKGKILSNN